MIDPDLVVWAVFAAIAALAIGVSLARSGATSDGPVTAPLSPEPLAQAEAAARTLLNEAAVELAVAGEALVQAAVRLKDDGRGFRASQARQAATRALEAAARFRS